MTAAVPVAVLGAGLAVASFLLAGPYPNFTGHLLHLRDPAMQALSRQLLRPEQYRTLQRRSAVFSHGVYTRYPFQANTFGLPPEVAYECVSGFLAAHFSASKLEPKN